MLKGEKAAEEDRVINKSINDRKIHVHNYNDDDTLPEIFTYQYSDSGNY